MSSTTQSLDEAKANPKNPKSEVAQQIACKKQTWTIPNFFPMLREAQSQDDLQAKVASFNRHVFYIRLPPDQKILCLQASLSLDASLNDLVIVFSLPDRMSDPQLTIQVTDIPLLLLSTPEHPTSPNAPEYIDFLQSLREQLVRLGKINLINEDYKCPLQFESLTNLTACQMPDNLTSLIIEFTMEFTITRPAEPSPPIPQLLPSSNLLESDFKALLNDSATADVELKVIQGGNKSFQCHKAVLSARSPVFREIFLGSFRDTNVRVLEIPDIPADAMAHFLSFIYTGNFQDSSWTKSLRYLACVADKYSIESLKELCDSNLIRSVTCTNALALGKLAERIGLTKAAKDIRQFIAENVDKVTLDICEEDGNE